MDKLLNEIVAKTSDSPCADTLSSPVHAQLQEFLRYNKKHQQIEEQLREKSERLNLALKAANLGTWSWDITTGEMLLDKHFTRLMGLPCKYFKGQFAYLIPYFHPDDHQKLREEFHRCKREKTAIDMEFRSIWPNKEVHNLVIRGNLYQNDSKNIHKIIGVGWDITEHKQNRENLNLRLIAIDAAHELLLPTITV